MERVIKKGLYRNFKGDWYNVLHEKSIGATNGRENEIVVVYEQLKSKNIYHRDINEFLSLTDKEKYPDAKQNYRFMNIDELKEQFGLIETMGMIKRDNLHVIINKNLNDINTQDDNCIKINISNELIEIPLYGYNVKVGDAYSELVDEERFKKVVTDSLSKPLFVCNNDFIKNCDSDNDVTNCNVDFKDIIGIVDSIDFDKKVAYVKPFNNMINRNKNLLLTFLYKYSAINPEESLLVSKCYLVTKEEGIPIRDCRVVRYE